MKAPPSPLRLLKERYFGEAARNPWVAKNALTALSEKLAPENVRIVSDAVHALIEYQDPDYALLYLDRVSRFRGPLGLSPALLGEMANLLYARMAFDDPIRLAQLKLARLDAAASQPNPNMTPEHVRFRLDEIAAMLPRAAAATVLMILEKTKWAGRHVTLPFGSMGQGRLRRLRLLAGLRITRPFSQRFTMERAWCERWLHMIERSLSKNPSAVRAVVATAYLIEGHGDGYARGLQKWNMIIDGLVKPGCDGTLSLNNLAHAVDSANHAAAAEMEPAQVAQVIAGLRAQAHLESNALV